jgi:putative glutamine amidotransferase
VKELVLVSAKNPRKAAPYLEALQAVGIPGEQLRLVTPDVAPQDARVDVAPERYGEQVEPEANVEVDEARDRVEWALLDGARDARVPVWGVCRGMQVVNVYLGGTLWQDIPTQLPTRLDHYPEAAPNALVHEAQAVDRHTALGDLLGREPLRVNSRHHQAVKELAPGLVPVAVAPDGVLEAFELPAADGAHPGWWLRAVQWHPENLVALAEQRELWRAFAATALPARSPA